MIQSARRASNHVILVIVLLSLCTPIAWFYLLQPLLKYLKTHAIHPTGIPWIQSETDCLATRRTWQDGICWDSEHDANF
jgi:hypothetical protein